MKNINANICQYTTAAQDSYAAKSEKLFIELEVLK